MYPRLESLDRIEQELRNRGFKASAPERSGRTHLVAWTKGEKSVRLEIQHDGSWDLLLPNEGGAYVGQADADLWDTMRRLAAYDK